MGEIVKKILIALSLVTLAFGKSNYVSTLNVDYQVVKDANVVCLAESVSRLQGLTRHKEFITDKIVTEKLRVENKILLGDYGTKQKKLFDDVLHSCLTSVDDVELHLMTNKFITEISFIKPDVKYYESLKDTYEFIDKIIGSN